MSDSQTPMPEAAKPAPKRKPRKSKPEPQPESVDELPADELLISDKPVHILPQLDEIDVDELPDELKNEPEVTNECVESYTETV